MAELADNRKESHYIIIMCYNEAVSAQKIDNILSAKAAAELLGISRSHLYYLLRIKELTKINDDPILLQKGEVLKYKRQRITRQTEKPF